MWGRRRRRGVHRPGMERHGRGTWPRARTAAAARQRKRSGGRQRRCRRGRRDWRRRRRGAAAGAFGFFGGRRGRAPRGFDEAHGRVSFFVRYLICCPYRPFLTLHNAPKNGLDLFLQHLQGPAVENHPVRAVYFFRLRPLGASLCFASMSVTPFLERFHCKSPGLATLITASQPPSSPAFIQKGMITTATRVSAGRPASQACVASRTAGCTARSAPAAGPGPRTRAAPGGPGRFRRPRRESPAQTPAPPVVHRLPPAHQVVCKIIRIANRDAFSGNEGAGQAFPAGDAACQGDFFMKSPEPEKTAACPLVRRIVCRGESRVIETIMRGIVNKLPDSPDSVNREKQKIIRGV